jgi:hypothetical protein
MRHELALLAQGQQSLTGKRLKADVSRLARGETAAVSELTQAMQTYYELAIQPHERGIIAAVQADRNVRLDAFAQAGIEGMLGSLRPMMTWEAGELQVQAHRDQEIHLDGRGLLIIPSYFCVNHPMTMFDPTLPPVLIYPVPRSPETLPQEQRVALSALIGQTRAAMLESIGSGCTTSELARPSAGTRNPAHGSAGWPGIWRPAGSAGRRWRRRSGASSGRSTSMVRRPIGWR